jgi:hypothetical protein
MEPPSMIASMDPTLLFTAAMFAAAPAQVEAPGAAVRTHSYEVLLRRIDHYFDRSKHDAIRERLRAVRGPALRAADDAAFMKVLNAALYEASGDKHLSIFLRGPNPPPADDAALGTYGIGKVDRLAHDVAYVEVTGFSNAPESREAVDRAMAKAAGASALILDLRNNGGGGEVSFHRLLGHLFPERRELGSIEWRECAPPPAERPDACIPAPARLERRFTDLPPVPGFPSGPVYVLVSKGTFSAAEALANEVKSQGRGTVVGERTGGGGNPSAGMDLESDFVVIMPIGRSVPVKGASWEGVGVAPDIAVPADRALDAALAAVRWR